MNISCGTEFIQHAFSCLAFCLQKCQWEVSIPPRAFSSHSLLVFRITIVVRVIDVREFRSPPISTWINQLWEYEIHHYDFLSDLASITTCNSHIHIHSRNSMLLAHIQSQGIIQYICGTYTVHIHASFVYSKSPNSNSYTCTTKRQSNNIFHKQFYYYNLHQYC